MINVEVQYIADCPNTPEMIKRVEEAISIFQGIIYSETLVTDNEQADKLKFLGSPTVLINGKDLLDAPLSDISSLACRYYPDGLPSIFFIRQKILEYMIT